MTAATPFRSEIGVETEDQLARRGMEALQYHLSNDPVFADRLSHRNDSSLLSLSAVFHENRTRDELRALAAESARISFLRRHRIEQGLWPEFEIHGSEYFEALLSGHAGAIIAPFHFGHYRLLPAFFLAHGMSLLWLSDSDNSQVLLPSWTQGRIGQYIPQRPSETVPNASLTLEALSSRLIPVDATSPTAGWQILRGLAAGSHAVLFPDGNSGFSHATARTIPMPFLGHQISARVGIAFIALLARTPIYPVILSENGNKRPTLTFEPPLCVSPGEARDAFVKRATLALFERLAREVQTRPGEWEEWHKLHRWFVRDSDSLPAPDDSIFEMASQASVGELALELLDPTLFWLHVEGIPRAVHVRSWNSLGTAGELGRLIANAEKGLPLAKHLDESDDLSESLIALREFTVRGFIGLRRMKDRVPS
jgi:lauroyl/myristoyl acyltransferase